MELEQILNAATNYGFPMVVSWYLLVRMEAKLDKLSENLEALRQAIIAM